MMVGQAYNLDPARLDAGATTSLGVLYYRVPGFPIGFGDKAKARQLLEQTQNEFLKAGEAFQHALKIPQHPDRPLWDKNRRLVIEERLAKIESKR
jgi:hypothetical protein